MDFKFLQISNCIAYIIIGCFIVSMQIINIQIVQKIWLIGIIYKLLYKVMLIYYHGYTVDIVSCWIVSILLHCCWKLAMASSYLVIISLWSVWIFIGYPATNQIVMPKVLVFHWAVSLHCVLHFGFFDFFAFNFFNVLWSLVFTSNLTGTKHYNVEISGYLVVFMWLLFLFQLHFAQYFILWNSGFNLIRCFRYFSF